MKTKALIGYGGHARETMAQMQLELPCFVDDEYVSDNTLPISKFDPIKYHAMIAIGDPQIRSKIRKRLPPNTQYFTFIHPSAQIMNSSVEIGKGSFIGANTILTTSIVLGNHSILNRGNHISHDCIIGDYFSAMPNSIISGEVKIGSRVYLGANSSIKEKITICSDVILGMNSGATKDINQPGTYCNTPAQKIKIYTKN